MLLSWKGEEKMTYIYDVLLNFNDDNRMIDFYEWKEEDSLEHIKKIPLFRISSKQMNEMTENKIRVSNELLEKIKGTTISYKNKKSIQYGALFSDLNKVIALEFDNKGNIISRSGLLLDEEEDIIEECDEFSEEKITYEIKEKYQIDYFLTREEHFKKNYLLKELKRLKEAQDIDKFNYLYEEVFFKDKLSFSERYQKMKEDIEKNYTSKYNELYEIVRLTYIKK